MPDLIYPRPTGRKKYISIAKHQRNALNNYSKWLSVNIERDVFDYADFGNFSLQSGIPSWVCSNGGNMWGLKQDRTNVGTDKQQFGFFQRPTNANNEWHGFPVVPYSNSRYNISKELLERWVQEGVIDADDIPAILNKKRI